MLAHSRKILRRGEHALYVNAQSVLENAHSEADAILRAAHNEAEVLRNSGFAEGIAEARHEQIKTILEARFARDAYLREVEPDLGSLVISVLRRVIGDIDHSDLVRACIHQSLIGLRGEAVVKVLVHPDHYSAVKTMQAEFHERCPSLDLLQIESSPSIQPGACLIDCAQGLIEYDLQRYLKTLEEAIQSHLEIPSISTTT